MDCSPSSDVDDITASLVREYLARKGLKDTLTALDQELPRTENSISNRVQLARSIGVEKLMRKNKESEQPFRTILDVITANFLEKAAKKKTTEPETVKIDDDKDEKMYRKMINPDVKEQKSDEMILEDAEDGETMLGVGNVASQRPDSGPAQQRYVKHQHRHSHGRVTSNLNDREQQKLKRALKQPKYQIQDNDKNSTENVRKNSSDFQNINNSASKRELELARSVKGEPVRRSSAGARKPSIESAISVAPKSETVVTKPTIDVMKVFKEPEKKRDESPPKKPEPTSPVKTPTNSAPPETSPSSRKPKTRAELLALLGMEDPNKIGPNAMKDIEEKPLVEKRDNALGDLALDDLDDADLADAEIIQPIKPKISSSIKRQSTPIDVETAKELKRVIFGTPLQQFYDEWKLQGFTFSNAPEVKYGIVQKKGGPCGVLASVQAYCLQALLFQTEAAPEQKKVTPMRSERTEALALGLSSIIWRCGGEKSAVVALPGGFAHFLSSNKFKADGLTETLMLTKFDDYKDLCQFLRCNIAQFETENSPGVVLLLYAAILSRGIDNVRSDMDDENGQLMGQHFYCTQDMVNLLLTGRACSNVFNDEVVLGDDEDSTTLKGLTKRSDIGFLSLFEHFKACQVGTYYKTPKFPIWVICSESHFSVMFSTKKDLVSDWKAERRFDLLYFDGLANQTEEIRLTIDTTSRFYEPPVDEDMVPPLENCIRTKWPEAFIDWNGTEPFL